MTYIRHEDKIIKIVDNYPISDTEEKTDIQMEIRKVYKKAHILDMTTTTFQGMSAEEVYRKAKAFDTFLKYKEHVEKYNNSDCHELQNVFNFVMKEYEEDE